MLSQAFCLTVFFVSSAFIARQSDTDAVNKVSSAGSAQTDLLCCPRPLLRTLQCYTRVYNWHTTLLLCFVFVQAGVKMLLCFLITLHFSVLSHTTVKKHARSQKNPPPWTEIVLKDQMVNYMPTTTHWAIIQLGALNFTLSEIHLGQYAPCK